MDFGLFIRAAALIAVLATVAVYGTDVCCAIVLRPALALVDDRALVAVMGSVHRYGDPRMPVPGVPGILATATTERACAASEVGPNHRIPRNAAGSRIGRPVRRAVVVRRPVSPEGERLARQIMTSPQFAADMAGFETDELDTTSFSPNH